MKIRLVNLSAQSFSWS